MRFLTRLARLFRRRTAPAPATPRIALLRDANGVVVGWHRDLSDDERAEAQRERAPRPSGWLYRHRVDRHRW